MEFSSLTNKTPSFQWHTSPASIRLLFFRLPLSCLCTHLIFFGVRTLESMYSKRQTPKCQMFRCTHTSSDQNHVPDEYGCCPSDTSKRLCSSRSVFDTWSVSHRMSSPQHKMRARTTDFEYPESTDTPTRADVVQ